MTPPTKMSLKIPMPRPEFFHHKRAARPSRLLPTPEEVEHVEPEREECRSPAEDSITREAKEWIESMIRTSGRWDNHLSIIRIDCPYTTADLLELGRLPQPEGVRICRQMVRAPVIYDEIGCFLWEKLAEMERGPNFRVEDEKREAEYAREVRMKTTLANVDERFLFENPQYATSSEETVAELAREVGSKTTLANLEDRFLFDTPKYATGEKDRSRQDSGSVSPTEVQQNPQEDRRRRSPPAACRPPHSPKACHFCGHGSICESTDALEDTRCDSMNATRGRVTSQKPRKKNSYASALLWHRDYASSIASSKTILPRSHSLTKVAHVVGNLGKNVGSTLGHSLSHGYGSRRGRAGSAGTV